MLFSNIVLLKVYQTPDITGGTQSFQYLCCLSFTNILQSNSTLLGHYCTAVEHCFSTVQHFYTAGEHFFTAVEHCYIAVEHYYTGQEQVSHSQKALCFLSNQKAVL